MQIRRGFLSLAAAMLLASCAAQQVQHPPAQYPGFASDRISVEVRGSGPSVILIPGLSSHREIWNGAASALETRYRVHLVQLNGFAGFPAAGNAEGPVMAPVAEEIARYIREGNLDHPAIIGHSMGGTIGMMVAARHPDAVGKLMVVDMFPFMGAMFGGQTSDAVRPIADAMRARMMLAPQGGASPIVEQMIAGMVATESARPRLVQHSRDSDVGVVANAFHELIVTDLRAEIANIRAPLTVLYVIPPEAPISPAQYDQYFHDSFAAAPQARLVKIEESRHFIMIDQPAVFVQQVEGFLSQ